MSRLEDKLPGGARLSDVVCFGALSERVPIGLVREVIAAHGRSSKRVRSLPADLTALYVVAMWLFRDVSYEEVLRCLLEGLRWLGLQRLEVKRRLPDGSFLSRIYKSPDDLRAGKNGVEVRMVEHAVSGSPETFRLVTSVLAPGKAPALELAALYHERWEAETTFDEIKTHLKGSKITLRSKTPNLVQQEFWALMIGHWSLRDLIHQAALRQNLDPDRVSFVHAVRIVRRTLPKRQVLSPQPELCASSFGRRSLALASEPVTHSSG
jgi:hypothetical protein